MREDGTAVAPRFSLIDKRPLMTGSNILFAHAESDRWKRNWWVRIEFDHDGRRQFEKITSAHVGRQLAIVLDGRLVSAPFIKEAIGEGIADIAGNFDQRVSDCSRRSAVSTGCSIATCP